MIADDIRQLKLPRVDLCHLPTPIEALPTVANDTGRIFVKRDDLSATPYGGNKTRKLQWWLGRAQQRGLKRVLTVGALGTNHGLATALFAQRLGLDCELVLAEQPVTPAVRQRLLELQATGATLHLGRSIIGTTARTLRRYGMGTRTLLIPPGGSGGPGLLGAVEAGLELSDQIRQGVLPAPKRVYIAVGTGGSAAGLALGLALGGQDTEVIAVRVSQKLAVGMSGLKRLIRRSLNALKQGGINVAQPRISMRLERGFLGNGYGHPSGPGTEAIQRAAGWNLKLDETYTSKAMAALLSLERGRTEAVLFWLSFAKAPALPLPSWEQLPIPFHRYFTS